MPLAHHPASKPQYHRPVSSPIVDHLGPCHRKLSIAKKLSNYHPLLVVKQRPYSELTIGVPCESHPSERRVALTPQNTALLLKKGFKSILVESGAGHEAKFPDEAYAKAGATIVPLKQDVFDRSDIVLKVRPPRDEDEGEGENGGEVGSVKEGSTVISFVYPAQNKGLVEKLRERKATVFAMDLIPRISRAQVFDALRYVFSFLRVELV